MTEAPVIALVGVLSGVSLFGGIACYGIWLFDRASTTYLWMFALSVLAAVTMLAGAVVISDPTHLTAHVARDVRGIAFEGACLVAVQATGRLLPGLPVRWFVRVCALGLVVRAVLSVGVHVVGEPRSSSGVPGFGVIAATELVSSVVVLAVGALAFRRTSVVGQRFIVVCGTVDVALLLAIPQVHDRLVFETLLTLVVLPATVGSLGLAGGAFLRSGRARERLLRRQSLITALSRASVDASADTLRRMAERQLREELDSPDAVITVSDRARPRSPDGPEDVSAVAEGRRQRAEVRGLGPLDGTRRGDYANTVLRIVASSADRASADAEFAHRSVHDDSTGLPTIELLRSRLDDRIATRGDADIWLVLCRLTGLRRVAAVAGTERTDELTRAAARALSGARRPGTTVARTNVDTFAVLEYLPDDDRDGFIVHRLDELRHVVGEAAHGAEAVHVGAVLARADSTARTMIRDAYVALDRAGQADGSALFDEGLAEALHTRVALERDLAGAVDRDEIEVRYQPIVDLATMQTVSLEALARWRRPSGTMAPDHWLPLAETAGLIHRIGRHVLSIAVADQPRLGVPVTVNVSPIELREPSFVADVMDALDGSPPELFTLEMTEHAVMADLDHSVSVLEDLRARGVRIALDDFGSSYSSLGALADLPVDVLKLDRSFVERLDKPTGVAVVEAMVALSRSLGKTLIAEGVETAHQLDVLGGLGVDRVQGFLLGRPVTADRLVGGRPAPTG